MSRILLGAICGLLFGGFAVATTIPLSFPDKRPRCSEQGITKRIWELKNLLGS
jgi:hypothetical protein